MKNEIKKVTLPKQLNKDDVKNLPLNEQVEILKSVARKNSNRQWVDGYMVAINELMTLVNQKSVV